MLCSSALCTVHVGASIPESFALKGHDVCPRPGVDAAHHRAERAKEIRTVDFLTTVLCLRISMQVRCESTTSEFSKQGVNGRRSVVFPGG